MVRIQVICEHCLHETIVTNLDWTHLSCPHCHDPVKNNLYQEDDDNEIN